MSCVSAEKRSARLGPDRAVVRLGNKIRAISLRRVYRLPPFGHFFRVQNALDMRFQTGELRRLAHDKLRKERQILQTRCRKAGVETSVAATALSDTRSARAWLIYLAAQRRTDRQVGPPGHVERPHNDHN